MYKYEGFHFYEWGLADKDGVQEFYLPHNEVYVSQILTEGKRVQEISGSVIKKYDDSVYVEFKTLKTIVEYLNHVQIDLLKMDIEGAEFAVIDELVKLPINVEEICLEVHNNFFKNGNRKIRDMVKKLNNAGYYIASVSSTFTEVTFIKA